MKSLYNYISEKLLINKDFKETFTLNCCKPDDKGKCLRLSISNPNNYSAHRIEISIESYTYYEIVIAASEEYKKNKNGYYWKHSRYWTSILLFNEDAERFLNVLLNELEQYFESEDFYDVFKNYVNKYNWPYQAKRGPVEKYFTKSDIEKMLKELKE